MRPFFTFDQDLARTTVRGNDGSLRRGGEGINHQGYVIATLQQCYKYWNLAKLQHCSSATIMSSFGLRGDDGKHDVAVWVNHTFLSSSNNTYFILQFYDLEEFGVFPEGSCCFSIVCIRIKVGKSKVCVNSRRIIYARCAHLQNTFQGGKASFLSEGLCGHDQFFFVLN